MVKEQLLNCLVGTTYTRISSTGNNNYVVESDDDNNNHIHQAVVCGTGSDKESSCFGTHK